MDCLGHAFTLPGAVITRGDDARAHGDAVEEAHQQKNRGAGGADRSQRTAAQEIPHDQGVGGSVKLLEQVAQKQGKGKGNDFFPDRPLCHQGRGIFHGFHGCFSPGFNGYSGPLAQPADKCRRGHVQKLFYYKYKGIETGRGKVLEN